MNIQDISNLCVELYKQRFNEELVDIRTDGALSKLDEWNKRSNEDLVKMLQTAFETQHYYAAPVENIGIAFMTLHELTLHVAQRVSGILDDYEI